MKTCSSDGTTCIIKEPCIAYTKENACNNAIGTEGACFWVVATDTSAASCRIKTCDDIPNGIITITCSVITKCVSDGTKCISKTTCASYKTKIAC